LYFPFKTTLLLTVQPEEHEPVMFIAFPCVKSPKSNDRGDNTFGV